METNQQHIEAGGLKEKVKPLPSIRREGNGRKKKAQEHDERDSFSCSTKLTGAEGQAMHSDGPKGGYDSGIQSQVDNELENSQKSVELCFHLKEGDVDLMRVVSQVFDTPIKEIVVDIDIDSRWQENLPAATPYSDEKVLQANAEPSEEITKASASIHKDIKRGADDDKDDKEEGNEKENGAEDEEGDVFCQENQKINSLNPPGSDPDNSQKDIKLYLQVKDGKETELVKVISKLFDYKLTEIPGEVDVESETSESERSRKAQEPHPCMESISESSNGPEPSIESEGARKDPVGDSKIFSAGKKNSSESSVLQRFLKRSKQCPKQRRKCTYTVQPGSLDARDITMTNDELKSLLTKVKEGKINQEDAWREVRSYELQKKIDSSTRGESASSTSSPAADQDQNSASRSIKAKIPGLFKSIRSKFSHRGSSGQGEGDRATTPAGKSPASPEPQSPIGQVSPYVVISGTCDHGRGIAEIKKDENKWPSGHEENSNEPDIVAEGGNLDDHQTRPDIANSSTTMQEEAGNNAIYIANTDSMESAYDQDALSYKKGDIIHILSKNESGMWKGTANGRTGEVKFIHLDMFPETQQNPHKKPIPTRLSCRRVRPTTVEELINGLGLPRVLINKFLLHEFETLEKFSKLDEKDLDNLEINDPEERKKLLEVAPLLRANTRYLYLPFPTMLSEDESVESDETQF